MKTKQARKSSIHPVTAALIRARWQDQAITAAIHALMGADLDTLGDRAGSMFFVALHATQGTDSPDRRIIRGATRALAELFRPGNTAETAERHKRSVWSGMTAVQRLGPSLDPLRIAYACAAIKAINAARGLTLADFPE